MSERKEQNSPYPYPSRTRRECEVAAVPSGRHVWIAGRLKRLEGHLYLEDGSGTIGLDWKGGLPALLSEGDILEVQGEALPGGRFAVEHFRRLAPGRPVPPRGSPNEFLWNLPSDLFEKRRRLKDALRSFFLERGFLEVETPILVPAPGQEPHLDPFSTRLEDGKGGKNRYLITSPEYYHKRLLVAGYEKIFEMARVFRNGPSEMSGLHHVEFLMVEWYRAFASYMEIMEDTESLVHALAREAGTPSGNRFEPPFERLSLEEAFARHARVDLVPYLSEDPSFAREEALRGDFGLQPDDSLRLRYFKIFVAGVEPKLGRPRPVFLVDFPASEASLSKLREDRPEVCERFELYIDGVELANGFTELNDPGEQRNRFDAEAAERAKRGAAPVPRDEAFLEALELGMPPSGGVALGFDRLLMVLFQKDVLWKVIPFMDR